MSILVTRTLRAGVIDRASPEDSIIGRSERAAYREQLDFGTVGDQLLHRLQYFDQMRPVRAYRGYSDAGPPVQSKMINFGDAELKAPSHLGDQRAYQRALLLERMDIAEQ